MDQLLNVDWEAIFSPHHSLLELFLRGTIMYLVIFVLLRVVLRRQVGGIGTSDILVIVLVAEVPARGSQRSTSRSSKAPCWSRPCCSGATSSNGCSSGFPPSNV